MPHIASTGVEAGPSSQILDHRPEIRAAWDALDDALLGPGSTLPVSLKENVRRAVATDLGCRYCSSFAALPAEPAESRTRARSARGRGSSLDRRGDVETLRDAFTEAQIAERAVARA